MQASRPALFPRSFYFCCNGKSRLFGYPLEELKVTNSLTKIYGASGIRCGWTLAQPDIEKFLTRVRDEFETSVVPGRFFGMPEHFRIGLGVDPEMFAEGLRRLELALDREGAVR